MGNQNIDIEKTILDSNISWCVTGKSTQERQDFFKNFNTKDMALVSLELATNIIMQERKNDDSEFSDGGIDIGRTVKKYLQEVKGVDTAQLEDNENIAFCGLVPILDRGLKYLSTGEMRRTLFCRALLEKEKTMLLHEPFAGLDIDSYKSFFSYIDNVVQKENRKILLFVERNVDIPPSFTNIIDFSSFDTPFIGKRCDYDVKRNLLLQSTEKERQEKSDLFLHELQELNREKIQKDVQERESFYTEFSDELVRFKNVNVAWGDNNVLDNLNWTLRKGNHTLVQGPNGSGKTTLLELITGDNTQVYCNDVWLFGKKRGSGETIWEVKKQIGIVSYKIHVEYKMLGGIDIEAVLLSGFHDSIGLYEQRSPIEQKIVKKWLQLAGFKGREAENFAKLSYGEQRLLLILRAAVKAAPILILDEPCHGLDEEWREKTLALMDIIAEKNISTILHVTHDQTEERAFEKHRIRLCKGSEAIIS